MSRAVAGFVREECYPVVRDLRNRLLVPDFEMRAAFQDLSLLAQA
jgi:hypothetical protein